jgi:hypothetical protein
MTALADSPPLADRYCHAWNVRGPGAGTAAMSGWLSGLPSTRGRVRLPLSHLTRPAVINLAAFPEGAST